MILLELNILEVTLILVLAYSAWRRDPLDRPLLTLRAFVLANDLGITGFRWLWFRFATLSIVIGYSLAWMIDVLFVAGYAGLWVTAHRYHRDRWPAHLGRNAVLLCLGFAMVECVHYVQRNHFGLGPWDVGVRWGTINLSCLTCAAMGGWHLTHVLRKKDVALAHLVLGFSIVVSLVQFLKALKPGAWNLDLYHLANLLFYVLSLSAYTVQLAQQALGKTPRSGTE